MSAYYDLFEKPDVRQTGEQQSLYARFVPKGTPGPFTRVCGKNRCPRPGQVQRPSHTAD